MRQQRISAVENMCYGINLVLAERDLRVHTAEIDVAAVVLTGSVGIKQDIVGLADGFTPVRVFPNPFSKCFFDKLLLALRDSRLFLIQNGNSAPFFIVLVIKNADILQVKCRFDDLIGVDALGAVGADGLHIAAILILALNAPFAGDIGVVDFHFETGAAGCIQNIKKKLTNIIRIQPCCAQPDGDLAGGKVYRLHSL